jgi:predicted Zn-dependent protease
VNQNNKAYEESKLSDRFSFFAEKLFATLQTGEHARISLAAEQTQFLRMSKASVRQNGLVHDAQVSVQFMTDSGQSLELSVPFVVNDKSETEELVLNLVRKARTHLKDIPADPYVNLPSRTEQTFVAHQGQLLALEESVEALLSVTSQNDDLVGIYASGPVMTALADSAGQFHWFASDSFYVDYAGRHWQKQEFERSLETARRDLEVLARPQKTLKPGNYRTYLAPSATSEMLNMLSWGALSEGALQRKESPLCAIRTGEKRFSDKFSLKENFSLGFAPRFSGEGETAPETIQLFERGQFVQGLVSARTEKEFGVKSNGAGSESLRSPDLEAGQLKSDDAFQAIGTGLYLSDLHYLNWSDMIQGRVTGMTRYACLWVEDGRPVGPIQDMRFDETLFRCFGSELEDLTTETAIIPETSTYGHRALGGARVPGLLLKNFQFTL